MEEFLESCRATSLLAELEDDEELPDADEDDNDDEANDDEEDYDDNYDEETTASGGGSLELQPRNTSSRRKTWDEEHVIKRKFSALIPAFDPRPGRTNVNQTSDLDVSLPAATVGSEAEDVMPQGSINSFSLKDLLFDNDSSERISIERESASPRLQLILRGPNMPGVADVEVDLTNLDWSIFKAVQHCIQASNIGNKADKIRRVWEPTYVIVYKEAKEKSPSGRSS